MQTFPALLVFFLVIAFGMAGQSMPHGAKPVIYVVDLRYADSLSPAERYDIRHTAACVQGIVNRDAPRVFLIYHDGDAPWLGRLTEEGGLCEGWGVRNLADVEALVEAFQSRLRGFVLYDADPDVPGAVVSTSLAATTAAGVEDAIAIRKDNAPTSLYSRLSARIGLPVLIDLTGKFTGEGTIWETETPSSGSAKCDAYLWALDKYMATGKTNPTVLSYTLDLWGLGVGTPLDAQLSNLDYAVREKAFCFELSPWDDEAPNDDPTQPLGTDLETFKKILDAANQQTGQAEMIKFAGFTNWQYKYTTYGGNGKHGEVATEWETVRLVSAYNVYLEADAPNPNYVSNASFYAGLRPAIEGRRYVQNPAPTYDEMVGKGLIAPDGTVPDGNYHLIGMGDYDQASWTLYQLAGNIWNDPVRGEVNCAWGVNPNGVDRVSVAMDYMHRHKTPRDYFVAWDSGAGYVNPKQLYGERNPSGYPSGVDIWRRHCRKYYRLLGYSISAWLLNGEAVPSNFNATDIANYAPFSGDGVGLYAPSDIKTPSLIGNVPVMPWYRDLTSHEDNLHSHSSGVHFSWCRTVLWRPLNLALLEARYADSPNNHRFLNPYEFYYLLRHRLGGNNHYRATWVSDTIPRIMAVGQTYEAEVVVRNDGWDIWSEAELYRLGHAIVPEGVEPRYADYDANGRHLLTAPVEPGELTTFTLQITAPSTTGEYSLYYDMLREGVAWFREMNNIEWKKRIQVALNEMDIDTDDDGVPDVIEEANGTLYWHPDDMAEPTSVQGMDWDRYAESLLR